MIEVKTEWFGARFGKSRAIAIRLYIKAMDIRSADLVRAAIEEYMINHPTPEALNE